MATRFVLKRKLFFLDPVTGKEITTAEVIARKKANGGSLKDALSSIKTDNATQASIDSNVRTATRNLNKQAHNQFQQMAQAGNKQGIEALKQTNAVKGATQGAFKAGQNSVGIMQGMKNTWQAWGKQGMKGGMKKAGVATAAAGSLYLMGKGLFGRKKNN